MNVHEKMKTGILQHKPAKKDEMVSTKMVLWSKVQAMVEEKEFVGKQMAMKIRIRERLCLCRKTNHQVPKYTSKPMKSIKIKILQRQRFVYSSS